jgi:hypothetical protein
MMPLIYMEVTLETIPHCMATLSVLRKKPHIAHMVKFLRIVVSPLNLKWRGGWDEAQLNRDEDKITKMIRKLAPHLVNLEVFSWKGRSFDGLQRACSSIRKEYGSPQNPSVDYESADTSIDALS